MLKVEEDRWERGAAESEQTDKSEEEVMSLHSRQHGAFPGCQPAPGPSTAAVGGTGWTRDPAAPRDKPHMRSTMRWSIPRALPCQETL